MYHHSMRGGLRADEDFTTPLKKLPVWQQQLQQEQLKMEKKKTKKQRKHSTPARFIQTGGELLIQNLRSIWAGVRQCAPNFPREKMRRRLFFLKD